jgi:translation initiation factor IF-3
LSKAQAKDLDLVEISAQADPPVCKIVNFSKFRYEIEKKEKDAKKKQKIAHLKEIRIRPNIADHDLEVKIKRARAFISDGDKVQLTTVFSGRGIQYKEVGLKIVDKVRDNLSDIAEQEGKQTSMGTRFFMTLIPKRKGSKQTADKK